MNHFIKKFLRSDDGVTLVEYGIALAVGILLGAGAFALLAGEITVTINSASSIMPD